MSVYNNDMGAAWVEATRQNLFNNAQAITWTIDFRVLGETVVAGRPEINNAPFFQTHKVGTGEEIETGPSVLNDSTIFQTHNIIDQEQLATPPSELEDSFIFQTHNITGQDNYELGTPIVEDAFKGNGYLIIPEDLNYPAPIVEPVPFTSIHKIGAWDLWWVPSSGRPVVQRTSIKETHNFGATSIETGEPEKFVGIDLTVFISMDEVELETGEPVLADSDIGQEHDIRHTTTVMAPPIVDGDTIRQTHNNIRPRNFPRYTSVGGVRYEPKLQPTTLRTSHELSANDLTGSSPIVNESDIKEVYLLQAEDIVGEAPDISAVEANMKWNLFPQSIAGEGAEIGQSSITQAHELVGSNLLRSAPYINTSTLGLIFNFGTDGITASPSQIGVPDITLSFALEADILEWYEPELDSVEMGHTHNIKPQNFMGADPLLGTPFFRIKEWHHFGARRMITSIPQVNTAGINGFVDPPIAKTPTASLAPSEAQTSSLGNQSAMQVGFLRQYSPVQVRDTWVQSGEAISDYSTRVHGGGGLYRVNAPGEDLHNTLLLFVRPVYGLIPWGDLEIKGRTP
ncbi:MAG: hypothetical protein LC650_05350, partial [Actinobacteria bacterium]|nr:hypothetical protein [Actinomycetota bacterium]